MKKYDCVVIGGGPAGYKAALELAEFNKSVCIIEADENNIGGTCLNEGCVPVKSLVESANLYSSIKNSAQFGISADHNPPDMVMIHESVQKNILQLKAGLMYLLKNKKIDIIIGKASFLSANKISAAFKNGSSEEFEADYFIIATGARPKKLPDIETGKENILNNSQILRNDSVENNLLIVGGGYIGCEFASIYSKLGSNVTILDITPQLLPDEDREISRTLMRVFEKNGISILTGKKITGISENSPQIKVTFENPNDGIAEVIEFDKILVSIGRTPNTSELGLEKIGVPTDNGFIDVDQNMKTCIDNIYAAGDVINTPMLAHTAYREGKTAALAISGIKTQNINYNAVPRIVFSSPQIGCLGLTEDKAKEEGLSIAVKKNFFKANAKAVISRKDAGFAKIVYDTSSRKILGVSVIGPEATELIHIMSFAVENQMIIDDISHIIYGHPTLSEIFDF